MKILQLALASYISMNLGTFEAGREVNSLVAGVSIIAKKKEVYYRKNYIRRDRRSMNGYSIQSRLGGPSSPSREAEGKYLFP